MPGTDDELKPSGSLALRASLNLLLEAHDSAGERQRPAWEFAVEIATLHGIGLSNTELRVLISRGLVEHSVEKTAASGKGRLFRGVGTLSLPPNTCLVLTERGIVYARALAGQGDRPRVPEGRAEVPAWDAQRRELRVGKLVVKRLRQPAPEPGEDIERLRGGRLARAH